MLIFLKFPKSVAAPPKAIAGRVFEAPALMRRERVILVKNIGIVSSRPDWPLRSLMPNGNCASKNSRKQLIEPTDGKD